MIEMDFADASVKPKIFFKAPMTTLEAQRRTAEINCLAVLNTLSDELIERLILAKVYSGYKTPALRTAKLGVMTYQAATSNTNLSPSPDFYANILCDIEGEGLSYDDLITLLDFVDKYGEGVSEDESEVPVRAQQDANFIKWIQKIEEAVPNGKPRK